MSISNESEKFNEKNQSEEKMNDVHVSSLADVATSHASKKQPGTAVLGTGLEARGVHAWFGKKHVLEDISLDFFPGTVTALIGPSGCGKSTFIRILNRMHEFIPTAALAGEVLLEGKDIYESGTDVTKIRLRIGMVFQKPNPFPKSIFDNRIEKIRGRTEGTLIIKEYPTTGAHTGHFKELINEIIKKYNISHD